MTILTITTDGILLKDDFPENFLSYAYKQIRCYLVDRVPLSRELDMWVDDEGMFYQRENRAARKVMVHYLTNYKSEAVEFQRLYGNVVITGIRWTDDGPEAGPVSDVAVEYITALVNNSSTVRNLSFR